MTIAAYGQHISINGIPLTEGDFNGACFSNYTIRLNSNDERIGWIMHIRSKDGAVTKVGFKSPDINITPSDYQKAEDENIASIEFEACELEQIEVSVEKIIQQQGKQKVETINSYDMAGRHTSKIQKGILIKNGQKVLVK